jgi:hypothetical protein
MFLFGSLAFGLEALLLGLGGQLSVLYRRDRKRVFKMASLVGLAVVGSSIATSAALGLGPLYFCASVLVFTLLASMALSSYRKRLIKPELPLLPIVDVEIKKILQKRGFEELVEEEKD